MNFEEFLSKQLNEISNSKVKDAMNYSLLAGGKRIRPRLLFAALDNYGIEESFGYKYAAAIEMIHTYSLIHDDLPAMDNDVLRRGKNTCHVEFDEATAILAGDGLLTEAFALAANGSNNSTLNMKCSKILSSCAGADGMILGQTLDMQAENKVITWDELVEIHRYKTGALLAAPLMIAACIGDDEEHLSDWLDIGEKIGLAFQIQDDILDVTKTSAELGKSNSDEENHKSTSVSLLGIDEATTKMNALFDEVEESCKKIKGFGKNSIITLIKEIRNREK